MLAQTTHSRTIASTECLWLRGGLPGEGFKGGGRVGPFFQRLTRMDPLGGICYSPRRTRAGNQPPFEFHVESAAGTRNCGAAARAGQGSTETKLSIFLQTLSVPMMTTMDRWKQYCVAFLGGSLLLGALGCAEFAGLNPVLRKQWREDEKILPSFHAHLKRVRALEAQAATMPREEQQRVSRELTRLIREDRNTLLRTAAVRSLSAFPQEMSREGIQVAATDKEPRLREVACAALGRLGDPASIGMLAALLQNDDDLDVRLAASQQLGYFSDPLAVQALGSALDDSNPALQFRAVQSLERASGRDYGRDLELWRAYVRGEEPPERAPSYAERLRSWF